MSASVGEVADEAPAGDPPYKCVWKPIEFKSKVGVKGGYAGKSHMADTLGIPSPSGREVVYMRVSKNDEWVLKCVAGEKAQRGCLKRTKLIETLRDLTSTHKSFSKAAVAELAEEEEQQGNPDPMATLDNVADDDEPAAKKQKYTPKRQRGKELTLTVPRRPKCVDPQEQAGTLKINVYNASTNQLWIRQSDVPWAIKFLAEEFAFGGVELTEQFDGEEGGESAVADGGVPGLSVKWDFDDNAGWKARFVSGPCEGERLFSKISSMSQAKWDQMNELHKYGKSFADASQEDKKTATYDFLVEYCRGMYNNASGQQDNEEHKEPAPSEPASANAPPRAARRRGRGRG